MYQLMHDQVHMSVQILLVDSVREVQPSVCRLRYDGGLPVSESILS